MNKLGIDASLWDFRLDVPVLKDAGVETAVIKIGSGGQVDPNFYKHAEAVAKGGLNLQVYYWDDIIIDPLHQADWVVSEIKKSGFPITFMWLDVEQWWSNWGLYNQAHAGTIPYSQVPRPSPANISSHFQAFMKSVYSYIPGRVGDYTNWGYISSWAMPMTSWIGNYPLWNPQYSNQPPKGYVCEWAELKAKWLPTVWPNPPTGTTPDKMVGYQFTGDAFKLPGVYDQYNNRMPLDVSLFKDDFLASIAEPAVVMPTPVVVPPVSGAGKYVVTVSALNIRKGPGTNYDYAGAALPIHTVVDVVSVTGDWAQLASGAYCYLPYLTNVVPVVRPVTITKYIVISNGLNIRKGPGANFDLAGDPMPKGATVSVTDVSGDWAHLTTGAWCYLPYLSRVI